MEIDLHAAIQTTEELLARLRELHGTQADDAPTRKSRRYRTEMTRTLLYLAHLGDRVSVEVMDTYFAFKQGADLIEEPVAGTADE